MFCDAVKKSLLVMGLMLFSVGSVSAEENELTDTQLHAFLGIVTNFILSDGIVHNGTTYGTVTSPYTGNIWLDRNLGAKRVCTSFDDTQCYGDYYQWGRAADGHEKSNSATTTTQADFTPVGHAEFIEGSTDWVTGFDHIYPDSRAYHWSQRDGSFVCPVGFRVPTIAELKAETLDNGVTDSDTAFASFLKLPSSGLRSWQDDMVYEGEKGYVWTSVYEGNIKATSLKFDSGNGSIADIYRASGVSIRCMKPMVATDEPPVVTLKSAASINLEQFDSYPNIGATAVDDVDGVLLPFQVGSVNMDVPGTYTVTFEATDSAGHTTSESVTVTVAPLMVTHNGTTYGLVRSPYTGKIWFDRNLGASQVCTSFDSVSCFGDYYQWGRNYDGHQDSSSGTTSTQAADVNSAGDKFITSGSANGYDWARSADSNGSLRSANWSKTDGTSVCPVGFRVPTIAELEAELLDVGSAEIQNRDDAFSSFLKLPSAGYHYHSDGAMIVVGLTGYVWSSSVSSANASLASLLNFDTGSADRGRGGRGQGFSVRCLRD